MRDGLANVPLPIDGFLSWLRAQGFVVGVDSYLQVQQLIERAGPECAPSDLKTVLCPLFARNEEQQEAFYRSFDRWFDLFAVTVAPGSMRDAEEGESPPAPSWGRSPTCPPNDGKSAILWRYAAAGGVVLVLVAAITFWMMKRTRQAQPDSAPAVVTTTAQDTPPATNAPPAVPKQTPPEPLAPQPEAPT